jgi:inhibitor of KinA
MPIAPTARSPSRPLRVADETRSSKPAEPARQGGGSAQIVTGSHVDPERNPTFPELCPVGLSGLLIRFADTLTDAANGAALAFRRRIDRACIPGVLETSTSLACTFVTFDPTGVSLAGLMDRVNALLAETTGAPATSPGKRLWRIPAAFGGTWGPQLDEAAALAGISRSKAVDDITSGPFRVMAIGFAPGQPYLGTLPQAWDLPRQSGLTPRVPAGSLVVAVRQLVLFANASPTGWRWIAQTGFRVFRPERDQPFALQPGDMVQFVPVPEAAMAVILATKDDPDGGATSQALT